MKKKGEIKFHNTFDSCLKALKLTPHKNYKEV